MPTSRVHLMRRPASAWRSPQVSRPLWPTECGGSADAMSCPTSATGARTPWSLGSEGRSVPAATRERHFAEHHDAQRSEWIEMDWTCLLVAHGATTNVAPVGSHLNEHSGEAVLAALTPTSASAMSAPLRKT